MARHCMLVKYVYSVRFATDLGRATCYVLHSNFLGFASHFCCCFFFVKNVSIQDKPSKMISEHSKDLDQFEFC